MTTLYRATDSTETGVPARSCWTEDYEAAVAYTDNPGYGGDTIRTIEADGTVLDVACSGGVDYRALAQSLGYDEAEVDEWRMSGWRYPWEESGEVIGRLRESGYDWLRYEDDYPDDCTTWMRLS